MKLMGDFMDKYEELANEIIDQISDLIEDMYRITPKTFDDDSIKNPALINGVAYYDLEAEIAEKIKEFCKSD